MERKISKKSIIFKLPVASSRWFLGMIFSSFNGTQIPQAPGRALPGLYAANGQNKVGRWGKTKSLGSCFAAENVFGLSIKTTRIQKFYLATKSRQHKLRFLNFVLDQDASWYCSFFLVFLGLLVTVISGPPTKTIGFWRFEHFTTAPPISLQLGNGQRAPQQIDEMAPQRWKASKTFLNSTFSLFAGYMDLQIV